MEVKENVEESILRFIDVGQDCTNKRKEERKSSALGVMGKVLMLFKTVLSPFAKLLNDFL